MTDFVCKLLEKHGDSFIFFSKYFNIDFMSN